MKTSAVLLFPAALTAATAGFFDSDLDGVEDGRDRCPDTPFEQTVGSDGCPDTSLPRTPRFGTVSAGASYASGTYGTSQTIESVSTDFSAALYNGGLSASVFGAWYARGAYDPTVASYDGGGMSDMLFSLAYTFAPCDALTLTPGVHLKLPTAADGLGTGETDFGASAQAAFAFTYFQTFVTAGYTVTGDGAVTYRDIAFGSLGTGMYLTHDLYGSITYDISQAYDPELADLRSLTLYFGYDFHTALSLQMNCSAGLSESAAQFAVSLMLTREF